MAELVAGAFLSSVFQVTLERLASTDFKNRFRKGLVKKLEITLNSINQVLDEAETKQYQSPNVKKWLDDLKHEVYEADQLLDEIATSAQRKGKLRRGFLSASTNPFESRIKELVEKLEFLAKQKDNLGLKGGSDEGGVSWKSSKRLPTTSLVDESSIYGREGYKEEIINFLLSDNDSGNQVPIISIVGLGGMGKTTLAQLVYNDHRIKKQFELKAWVYVSESCEVVGLTKAILKSFHFSAKGEHLNLSEHGESLDLFQHLLKQNLTGKPYLLVLDDVWNGNKEFWECLLLPFNHGSSRGKIIVTTRDKNIASVMNFTKLVELKQLEKSECWSLFERNAFRGNSASEYPDLKSIGERIVDKCGGLPLAVKTLGNLLQRKFSRREWVKILETDLWCLPEDDSNVNPVLRFSYHNLPSNLKRCFAYCSIFPKGYDFDKDLLIKLWMAEGLLKCCQSGEDLGSEFFEDLESISFLQQLTLWSPLSTRLSIMHDLVNDLAKSVSGEFCFRIEDDRVIDIPERTRHIWCSLDLKDGDRKLEHIYKIKGLRSLILQEQGYGNQRFKICNNVQRDLFSRLKHLRMLSFRWCNLGKLADEISNLKLLRYLDLSLTGIKRLPDSICTLYNLQTLLLAGCLLSELPSDFCKLVNLRRFDLGCYHIKKTPKRIERLHHLQMLPTEVVVGKQSGSNIKELGKLNHLHGTLRISGLENVIDPAEAAAANLKDKKYLEELDMMYTDSTEMDGSKIEREVSILEALQPSSNLNRLTIKYYYGNSFPSWLGDCHLPKLVSLQLWGCEFCSRLPPLGKLPSLKELSISRCHGIEIIGEEFYGNNSSNAPFSSLEILRFSNLSGWKEWLCVEGCFPLLKDLSIARCCKLKRALPQHLPSLERLVICNCQELEASIPKAANISDLELDRCENILVNELPSSLKKAILRGHPFSASFLQQNIFNNAFLEDLELDLRGFVECSSLDLRCCTSLRQLSIRRCSSFSLPFALHLLTNLHSLRLFDCPQLESFPAGGFPSSLSSLQICRCPKLIASREEWGLFKLNSLNALRVSDEFENVESFPEENLLPPSLDFLWLTDCSKLRIINYKGLLHLKSLESLWIWDCPCLERLPEEGLPSSLSTLYIYQCSLLKQQYQKEQGERWHKIRHIPSVTIVTIDGLAAAGIR